MSKSIVCFLFLLLLQWLPIIVIADQQEIRQELVFGSVAMDIPYVMHQRLSPLKSYLSKSLGIPVSLKLSHNMKTAIQDTVEGKTDLAYLTPVAYIKAHAQSDVRLVVKTVTKGKGSFRLMIVVNEKSPITRVEELAGKTFAFGDKAALLQRAVVVSAGIPLESLGRYEFLGHYDNIVRAVISGDFDAGILKDTMAYKWQTKGIKILYSSDELPPYNISVSKNVNDQLLKKIQQAFLSLDASNPEHLAVIRSVDSTYNGFDIVRDSDYDIVRRLIKPFESDAQNDKP